MKGILTIALLIVSNVFMTLAWYGHLKFKEWGWFQKTGLWAVILVSWGLALFEYIFQVPANRNGYIENGGPFSLVQLKVIQEVITLSVFTIVGTISENASCILLLSVPIQTMALTFSFTSSVSSE